MLLYRALRPDQPQYSLAGRFYCTERTFAASFGGVIVVREYEPVNPLRVKLWEWAKRIPWPRVWIGHHNCCAAGCASDTTCEKAHAVHLIFDILSARLAREMGHDCIIFEGLLTWCDGEIVQLVNER